MARRTRIAKPRNLARWNSKATAAGPPKAITAARRKAPDYLDEPVPPASREKPCRVSKRGKLRKCHVELYFAGEEAQARLGIEPGPYLRICGKAGDPGDLVPVKNHREAHRVSRAYCECRRAGGRVKACVRKARG